MEVSAYVAQGLAEIGRSNGFANSFWITLGIIIGVLVQFFFHRLVGREQRKNALRVLQIEIALNLEAFDGFMQRLRLMREKISAGQVKATELNFDMREFDFSAMSPLVYSGHFHSELGSSGVQDYFRFVRFFSNNNAPILTDDLVRSHNDGHSIDFLDNLEKSCMMLRNKFAGVTK